MNKYLLNPHEAAKVLGIPRTRIQQWAKRGQINFVRVSFGLRFFPDEIKKLIGCKTLWDIKKINMQNNNKIL